MRKTTAVWLIAAAACILIGSMLFVGVMTVFQWDFSKLSTAEYITNTHPIDKSFANISIATDTANVVLIPDENATGVVTCYEQDTMQHTVEVKDNTLVIRMVDTRKWYHHIGILCNTPKITVSIPKGDYGAFVVTSDTGNSTVPSDFSFKSIDITTSTGRITNAASALGAVNLKTSTGGITLTDITADTLSLSVSTGNITANGVACKNQMDVTVSTGKAELSDITCDSLTSHGDTGKITLQNVIAANQMTIERSTGNVILEQCDASHMVIHTDTGHVKGTLLSDKQFTAETDTGRVSVPVSKGDEPCFITTSTGNITVNIKP